MNLTPDQLERLARGETVRVVERCRRQPNIVINGVPARQTVHPCGSPIETQYYFDFLSPFPAPGTVETFGDTEGVWGESECKQCKNIDCDGRTFFEMLAQEADPDSDEKTILGEVWFWTTTITPRKEGEA